MPTAYHVDYHYKYIGFALLTTSRFDSGYYNGLELDYLISEGCIEVLD
jgi:hypothetical protein